MNDCHVYRYRIFIICANHLNTKIIAAIMKKPKARKVFILANDASHNQMENQAIFALIRCFKAIWMSEKVFTTLTQWMKSHIKIMNFHSDNGGKYVNYTVEKLLKK